MGERTEHKASVSEVSVVIPAFNAAGSIANTIQSVFCHMHPWIDCIVVDDGSTDETKEIVSALQHDYPSVRYFYQPHRGAGAARNLGIEAATGRYIAFLDSDDLWLPGKLEAQIGFMQREQVALSYGDYAIHRRSDDQRIGEHRAPDMVAYRDLLRGCPIGCLTAAYDQQALGKVYMPDVRRGQDWGLWLALTRMAGPARKYPGMHAVYRHGGNSLSANKLAKLRDIFTIYREQEGLGTVAASVYLACHAVSALRKRP